MCKYDVFNIFEGFIKCFKAVQSIPRDFAGLQEAVVDLYRQGPSEGVQDVSVDFRGFSRA